ncbi:MAG: FAD-binding oxidoreductase [Ignavibacteriaceae bacterium]|nr:FAD-binding oxidoreductase [Ignavibacteriaceae bacterium]
MIIKTSPDEIQNYLSDASNYKGFCEAVYFPENEQDISGILKEASIKNTPVTISGNGTGLTGARVPQGGIVISTEKLNKIIEINKEQLSAEVEPGVLLSDFQEKVKGQNLLYPPDPTEKNCFIGGTVATNASGEKTFKYGPTRDYITELNIVLPDGDILRLKRGSNIAVGYNISLKTEAGRIINIALPEYKMPATKNAAGYYCKGNMDAIDLFIGSEGTLGVISKIKLKLVPLPEKLISCVIFFFEETDALNFIATAREISYNTRLKNSAGEIDALALEYFDERALNFLRDDYNRIPDNAKAAVWFEQEVKQENEDAYFEKWLALISDFNGDEESAWFAVTEEDKKKILEFRHSISVKINEYISKKNLKKLGTDVAVPHEKFKELYFYSKQLVQEQNLAYVIYRHAGNSHIHLNMLPDSEEQYKTGVSLYSEICRKAIELGGTVSAEHGIGKLKTGYFNLMYGEDTIHKMIGLKKIFDPNMILGKGNIFNITT